MTAEGWKEVVLMAVERDTRGEPDMLVLLVQLLTEQDAAKQELRRLGYGVTGTPWPKVVQEIPSGWR